MGIDYTSYCKTCRAYQDHDRFTRDCLEIIHNQWTEQFHKGHDVVLTTDLDEYWDNLKIGYNIVEYVGYGAYRSRDKGEPYREQMNSQEYKDWTEQVKP